MDEDYLLKSNFPPIVLRTALKQKEENTKLTHCRNTATFALKLLLKDF